MTLMIQLYGWVDLPYHNVKQCQTVSTVPESDAVSTVMPASDTKQQSAAAMMHGWEDPTAAWVGGIHQQEGLLQHLPMECMSAQPNVALWRLQHDW